MLGLREVLGVDEGCRLEGWLLLLLLVLRLWRHRLCKVMPILIPDLLLLLLLLLLHHPLWIACRFTVAVGRRRRGRDMIVWELRRGDVARLILRWRNILRILTGIGRWEAHRPDMYLD
jgi:hypothetical protein